MRRLFALARTRTFTLNYSSHSSFTRPGATLDPPTTRGLTRATRNTHAFELNEHIHIHVHAQPVAAQHPANFSFSTYLSFNNEGVCTSTHAIHIYPRLH